MIKKVLKKIIQANNLERNFPMKSGSEESGYEVSLIHNEQIVIMYFNLDQRFFLTVPIVKLSQMKEENLALIISHELAHYLLDH